MSKLIAKIFHNDFNELTPLVMLREVRDGHIKAAGAVEVEAFYFERTNWGSCLAKDDSIDQAEAFAAAEKVYVATNDGGAFNHDPKVVVLKDPRRSTSVGDLIAFYEESDLNVQSEVLCPVFVARCDDRGWVQQRGEVFFPKA